MPLPYADQIAERRHRRAILAWRLWVAAYLFAMLAPVALLATGPERGGDRLDLFALYAGYVAFTAYALQLVLPSRLPSPARTFGIPTLLRVHKQVGTLVLLFALLHAGTFAVHHPEYREWLLWPFDDEPRAWLGWIGIVALLVLLTTTWWRRLLRIPFEPWRLLHVVLGLVGTGAALAHAMVISWYSAYTPVRWYLVTLFVLGVASVAYLRIVRPFVRLAAPYAVTEVVHERGGATTLRLQAIDHAGVPFVPGQFAWLKVEGGVYTLDEHPFSFASNADDPLRPSFTIRAVGDFTRDVAGIGPGTTVLLDGPHGAWTPPLPSAGYVLIVAGIGITPAMSVLRTIAARGDGRPVTLLYGARDWEQLTFREELQELAAREDLDIDVVVVLSRPHEGWGGATGRLDASSIPALLPSDAGARNVLVCGSPPMVDGALHALNRLGVPDELVYADRF